MSFEHAAVVIYTLFVFLFFKIFADRMRTGFCFRDTAINIDLINLNILTDRRLLPTEREDMPQGEETHSPLFCHIAHLTQRPPKEGQVAIQLRLDPHRPPVVVPVRERELAVQVLEPPDGPHVRVLVPRRRLLLPRVAEVLLLGDGGHDLLDGDPVGGQQAADGVRRVDEVLEALVRHLQPPAVVLAEDLVPW